MEILINIARMIVLGILIFVAITLLPNVIVSTQNKIVIAIAVVLAYSFLGVIGNALSKLKVMLCGCDPDSFDLDFEIDETVQDQTIV